MIRISHLALTACILTCQIIPFGAFAQDTRWSPEQVYYGSEGKLAYTPDEKGNTIPDFSHVGYMYGDEPIPDVPVVVEVSPVEGDDGATIQAAIHELYGRSPDANGFRGAVLLKKGTYEVKGQLTIRMSGIVLRGEGQTDDGTVVIADGTLKRSFLLIGNGSGREVDPFSKVKIVEDYVPLGRKFVVVEDGSGFSEGDQIALYRPGTANWISDLKMDQIPNPDGQTKQWTPDSYTFYFERKVTKVKGDTIYFRNPVVMAMESKYGGGYVFKSSSDRIQKVGVEDIYFKSAYKSATDEEHAWVAVDFQIAEHSWARRVTSRYFGYACVSVGDPARLITVEDCHSRDPISVITGGRRYSFNLSGSLTLFKDCTTTEGRHDFVTGSRVCGPNAFVNCSASNVHADIGPHHRWAMGTLYDNIESDGAINVQDRGASGSGHGWAGANQVFWNCNAASSICQSPWVSAKNYNFAFTGEKNTGTAGRPDGEWVGHNRPGILPKSLYQAQLNSRLGKDLVFSAYKALEKVNDSSFIMSFNLPYLAFLATSSNFSVTGDAGYENAEFTVDAVSDTSVMLVFDGIGPLPAFSTMTVTATNMMSTTGKALEGLISASYVEPDLRPVVTGTYAQVNNEDDTLQASSSKPGTIYLVRFNDEYNFLDAFQTVNDLEQAVAGNLGRKADAPVVDSAVSFATNGLPGGYYIYFAADNEGRISEPGDVWPEVLQTGPLLGLNESTTLTGFKAWSTEGSIMIQPDRHDVEYSVGVFDITGRLLQFRENLAGEQQIMLPGARGIVILKLASGNDYGVKTCRLYIHE